MAIYSHPGEWFQKETPGKEMVQLLPNNPGGNSPASIAGYKNQFGLVNNLYALKQTRIFLNRRLASKVTGKKGLYQADCSLNDLGIVMGIKYADNETDLADNAITGELANLGNVLKLNPKTLQKAYLVVSGDYFLNQLAYFQSDEFREYHGVPDNLHVVSNPQIENLLATRKI